MTVPPDEPPSVHTRIREQFSAYLEGELDLAQNNEIDAHVASCVDCSKELTQLRATLGRLGNLRTKAPGSFLADVQNQIRTRSKGRFFSRRHLFLGRFPFEWVSLAMIVAMLVYYIYTTHSVPTQVAPGP